MEQPQHGSSSPSRGEDVRTEVERPGERTGAGGREEEPRERMIDRLVEEGDERSSAELSEEV
jgi:hypothetical protein